MAEELLHAYSTRTSNDESYVGFVKIPAKQEDPTYEQNHVYAHHIDAKEIQTNTQPFKENENELRLTENLTNLILHFMLPILLPKEFKSHDTLCLFFPYSNAKLPPLYLNKSEELIPLLLESLLTGNSNILLGRIETRAMLEFLKLPGLVIASLKGGKQPELDSMFIF